MRSGFAVNGEAAVDQRVSKKIQEGIGLLASPKLGLVSEQVAPEHDPISGYPGVCTVAVAVLLQSFLRFEMGLPDPNRRGVRLVDIHMIGELDHVDPERPTLTAKSFSLVGRVLEPAPGGQRTREREIELKGGRRRFRHSESFSCTKGGCRG